MTDLFQLIAAGVGGLIFGGPPTYLFLLLREISRDPELAERIRDAFLG